MTHDRHPLLKEQSRTTSGGTDSRRVDVLAEEPEPRVLVVGYGQLVGMALEVGRRLSQQGIAATIVDLCGRSRSTPSSYVSR